MQKALNQKDDTAAWAGGYKGREVIDKLTPRIREFLTDTGVFYLLLIEVSLS
jgi:methylase of polypeptide subunit release factors